MPVCTCSQAVYKLEVRRQLVRVNSLLPPYGSWGTWTPVMRLGSKHLCPLKYLPGLTFSHSPTPLLLRQSLTVYPRLSWTFGNPPVLTSPIPELQACTTTPIFPPPSLLLVKWTKSRVSQLLETATNLHKWDDLMFIVHTFGKIQVWGKICRSYSLVLLIDKLLGEERNRVESTPE